MHQRKEWPVGQVVKTEASHAFNIGSNPVRVTTQGEGTVWGDEIALDKAEERCYNLAVKAWKSFDINEGETLPKSWC